MKNFINFSVSVILLLAICGCKKNNLPIGNEATANSSSGSGLKISAAPTGTGTQWYVAANGLTTNDGLSPTTPKGSIREVADQTNPGDVVNIMSSGGEFKRIGTQGAIMATTKSGAPGQYITFRGYPVGGAKPVIRGYSVFSTANFVGASYLKIENIEFVGDISGQHGGPALTKSAADAVYTRVRPIYLSTGTFTLNDNEIPYQTSGITLSGNCHHIEITKCVVHDFPGAGIAANFSDYITIQDNNVFNCASLSIYGHSGISYLRPYNFDGHSTGYAMIVRRNVCYYNKSTVNCYTKNGLSDGNGIIGDISTGYTGDVLIENNISYNNGGGGIHMVTGVNVFVVNNTAYNNGQVLPYAEMDASYGSSNVRFTSNIMYAKTGGKCIDNSFTDNNSTSLQNSNIVYYKNVFYNGSINPPSMTGVTNTDYRTTNPQFVNIAPGTTFDFRLKTTASPASSAANFGSGITGYYSLKDILDVTRIVNASAGKYPDCGAYESFN